MNPELVLTDSPPHIEIAINFIITNKFHNKLLSRVGLVVSESWEQDITTRMQANSDGYIRRYR